MAILADLFNQLEVTLPLSRKTLYVNPQKDWL